MSKDKNEGKGLKLFKGQSNGHYTEINMKHKAEGDRFFAETGPLGGIHEDATTGDKYYVKRETIIGAGIRYPQIMAEYLVGSICHEVHPENFPEIYLGVDKRVKNKDEVARNTYVASKIMEGFTDLTHLIGYERRPKTLTSKDREKLSEKLGKTDGFIRANLIRKLFGDDDINISNVGVVLDPETMRYQVIGIDFGTALVNLKSKFDPHAAREQNFPWPYNHYIDYPVNSRVCKESVDEIKLLCATNFQPMIDKRVDFLAESYPGVDRLKEFARYAGMPSKILNELGDDREILCDGIKNYLGNRIVSRQASLKEYGAQIEVGLIMKEFHEEKKNHKQPVNAKLSDYEPFKAWAEENKEYAKELLLDKKPIHFRHKELTNTGLNFQMERFVSWLISLVGIENKHSKELKQAIGNCLEMGQEMHSTKEMNKQNQAKSINQGEARSK